MPDDDQSELTELQVLSMPKTPGRLSRVPGDLLLDCLLIRIEEAQSADLSGDLDTANALEHDIGPLDREVRRRLATLTQLVEFTEAFVEAYSADGEFNTHTAEHSPRRLRQMAKKALAAAEAAR